jgi:hypothetical protein
MEHECRQEKTKHFVDVLANREINSDLSETLLFVSMPSSSVITFVKPERQILFCNIHSFKLNLV